jgi:valyl-tRNA synthetase
VIEKFGADALRFTLTAFAAMGRDIKLSEPRIEGYRFFINKLWNAARFIEMNTDESYTFDMDNMNFTSGELTLSDKWLLSRLQSVTEEVTDAFESYEFNVAANSLYQFVWHEFCDWYLEISKIYLYSDDESAKKRTIDVLYYTLIRALKLLHPIIPFVTEEIFSHLKIVNNPSTILMKSPFPKKDDSLTFKNEEDSFALIVDVVSGIRNVRGEMNIHPKKRLAVMISSPGAKELGLIKENGVYIESLSGVEKIEIGKKFEQPEGSAVVVSGPFTIYVPLVGVVDFGEEKKRLLKEMEKIENDLKKVDGKLTNEAFIAKAPEDVVEKERSKKEKILVTREKILESIESVEKYI